MKTIEQLLDLSKNPFYKFTNDEKAVLDDFLSEKRAKDSANSRKKSSRSSEPNTPVRVRNIVEKTIPHVEDAPERTQTA